MRHAVIMAGGKGSRLWPLSRESTPKQFNKVIGDETLIQQTYNRLKPLFDAENIWVVTNESYKNHALDQLPLVPESNIITEPAGRNTAAGTLLAAMVILDKDPDAVLFGVVPADHYIGKADIFQKRVADAMDFIDSNPTYFATLGIHPTRANTGYGYIKMGQPIGNDKAQVYQVESFHEKPDPETAQKFVQSGDYIWNAGYYFFSAKRAVEVFDELAADLAAAMKRYLANPSKESYETVPSLPIDTAISEKLSELAVLPAEMGWSDVGNFASLQEILEEKGHSAKVQTDLRHVSHNSKDTTVMGGDKVVVTVGLENVVVVDGGDVILICSRDSVQDIKKVVEQLQRQGREHLL